MTRHTAIRTGIRVLAVLLALGTASAFADAGLLEKMHQINLESDEKTVAFTDALLAHPQRLTDEERLSAQAYRCEALSTLGLWPRVDDSADELEKQLPAVPAHAIIEPAARWLACVGFAAKQRGDLAGALARFNRAIAWLGHGDDLGETLSFLLFRRGGLYDSLGDYSRATVDLTRALRAIEHLPDSDEIEAQRNNVMSAIARIELHRGEFASAETYYRKLADYAQRGGDPRSIAVIDAHLGEALLGLGRDKDAAAIYAVALASAQIAKDDELTGRAEIGLGRAAIRRNDFAAAQLHLDRARAVLANARSPVTMRDADMARMEMFSAARDWRSLDGAGGVFLDAKDAASDRASLARMHEMLARSAEAQGRFEGALVHQRQAGDIRAALAQSERADAIAKSRIEFDVAELEARASALEHQRSIATMRADAQQSVNRLQRGIIALAVALLVFALVSVRRHIRAERRMRELANQDALTGLANRRAVLEQAAAVIASLDGGRATLAMVDIDHFKRINDQFGHAVGDAVLRAVAQCQRECLRDADVIGRTGGEEFLIVLPGATLAQGAIVLDGIRQAIGALALADLPPGHRLTVSIGYTEIDARSDLGAAMHAADCALYEAKHRGRDRIVAHQALPADS